ncbi:hypothetical protein BVD23_17145 [Salmonella enterica]|nr:hypothetical protein [Salmonella enterica]ECJ5919978.1 hypothetical protein [Salmonella enterica subsp. salamae]EAN4947860.1 hypothetical protein [Salmonella enterica]EAX8456237.1 hypothetical protein [Salmonella enterica]EAX8553906.1 hypothetical protein [Salmonella enterica]
MLKKIPFFKKSGYRTKNLPFLVFNRLVIVMQIICITVLLVCAFIVVLNNVGKPVDSSPDTIIRSE